MLDILWDISYAIYNQEKIEFDYTRMNGSNCHRKIEPLAIMFSEFYFYLIAWFDDHKKDYPTVFRIDRIYNFKNTKEKFRIPYESTFNDGEFRKRVIFMYSGELKRIKFEFTGPSIEAILDRLPTAEIISSKNNTYTIRCESYGNGVRMWLKTQGDYIKIIE